MNDSQKWLLLAAAVLFGWVVYLLAPVLTPFLAGALLAYLGDPLVDRLEARRIPRTLAVSLVFVALFALLGLVVLLLVPMVESQVTTLMVRLPGYLDALQKVWLPRLAGWAGIEPGALDLGGLREAIRSEWQQAGGLAARILGSLSASGLALLAWVANLVLLPVVTFYMLRDWDRFTAGVREMLPRRLEPVVVDLARQSDQVLGAFLRGQLLVMLALGGVYSVGLWLVGLDLALLIGMVAGLLSFVPYLGFILGLGAASTAVLLNTPEVTALLPVVLVFAVGQMLEGFLLTPWLVGDRIGLHPVAVIFAVLAGGQLFGFVGVLLGLPIAAVIAVLVRHAHERYRGSRLYSEASAGEEGP